MSDFFSFNGWWYAYEADEGWELGSILATLPFTDGGHIMVLGRQRGGLCEVYTVRSLYLFEPNNWGAGEAWVAKENSNPDE